MINEIESRLKEKNHDRELVAWMVSNCNAYSQRELYVSKMMEYISVDVYGECGTLKCSKYINKDCLVQLDTNYKFYLR